MDGNTLRELQAPIKQQYRDEPASALTPLEATGAYGDPGITCTVDTWAGPVRAGLHPATGGDGKDACAGVTMRSVATALGIDIRGARLHAKGQFDARGTLGISRTVPVGVHHISLIAELDTDADDQTLARLAELTERYCVVAQSLAETPSFRIQRTTTAR